MDRIKEALYDSAELKKTIADTMEAQISEAINLIRACYRDGGKLLLMGNGGSAGDAQHIAAEFVGRYKKERRPVAALALTVDSSLLTCVGNDYGFEHVFSRQVEALAGAKDVVIGISTSGNSENVIRGVDKAREKGVKTIGLLGREGGKLKDRVDLALVVPSSETARIQEAHITIGHIICEILDEDFD
ncbi:MAG: SIS domain-containing protein [Nitrospinaceae bacterium]|nr:D-sedoheptulose 7-phosphate isomerase [Nitrospinaceae bacterium]NIR56196.1 D-sedoheptulose 7-phosphate isomerase [Nitrospinaceae bacterium]NIS86652.1 D-sedoheptulose 7-phosphate isomerase [Nitrospinaceae bacterium]NIT83485.1 D-sedoheptulose 7-phosphate isomerase [Nitrospinaceae bacterium]NIU45690.1 D-sedoheptulose 7-phosphate isomerase [Nitrospinaceae bacterium]